PTCTRQRAAFASATRSVPHPRCNGRAVLVRGTGPALPDGGAAQAGAARRGRAGLHPTNSACARRGHRAAPEHAARASQRRRPLPGLASPRTVAAAPMPARSQPTASPSSDESAEIWLVRKNNLDFGPFSLANLKRQIEKGEIEGDHILIDSETGRRTPVESHPVLGELIAHTRLRREERHREERAHRQRVHDKRRNFIIVIFLLLVAGGGVAVVLLRMRMQSQTPVVLVKEVPMPKSGSESELAEILRNLSFEFPKPVI